MDKLLVWIVNSLAMSLQTLQMRREFKWVPHCSGGLLLGVVGIILVGGCDRQGNREAMPGGVTSRREDASGGHSAVGGSHDVDSVRKVLKSITERAASEPGKGIWDDLEQIARENPEELIRWIDEHANDRSLKNELGDALVALSRYDADAAIRLAEGKTSAVGSPILVTVFYDFMARNGIEKSLEVVARLPLKERDAGLIGIASVPDNDVATTLKVLAMMGKQSSRDQALAQHFRYLGFSGDGLKIMELARQLPETDAVNAVFDISVSHLLRKYASGFFYETLSKTPLTSSNSEAFQRLLISGAAENFDQIKKVVDSLPSSKLRDRIVMDFYEQFAVTNTEEAIRKLENVSEADSVLATRGVVRSLSSVDLAGALELANRASSGQQLDIYREIARTSALQQPENAVKILEDPILSEKIGSDFRQEMLNATVATWAKQDLSAARDWVERLPEADSAKGYQGLMTSWMKADPVAASEWLSKQAVGPARDAGAKVLIEQIKDTDPERAEQWRKSLAPAKE
ncbi:MAG: hypothetical protein J0M04_01620 [Verrucomicrobia bacterium]|nr:hypothetical protein [Verrucomicrobiota bacterium]